MAAETEIERLVVRLVGDGTSYQKMVSEAGRTAVDLQKNLTGVFGVLQQLTSAIPVVGPVFSTAMGIAGAAVSKLKGLITGLVSSVGSLVSSLVSLPSKIGSVFSSIGAAVTSVGQKFAALGMQLTVATAPLAMIGAKATQEMLGFSSATSQMVGLVGLSKDVVAGFAEEIKGMAWTGKGPTELAEAMFFITSAGFRGENAMEALTISAKAASAGLGSTKSVADAVTSAVNAYGEANLSSVRATEVLTAAVRAGKAEASSFAPVLGQILPTSNELGISFDQVGGVLAYLTKSTGSASLAATGLRGVMTQLIRPTEDVKKMFPGLTAEYVKEQIAIKGLLPFLIDLKKSLADQGIPITKMFSDIEGLNAVLQLTGPNVQDALNVINDVGNSVGIVDEAFKAASETMGFQFNVKMAEMKVLLLEIGDLISPMIGQFLDWSRSLIGIWKQLDPGLKKIAGVLIGTATAIGPALGFISSGFLGIGTSLSTIGAILSTVLSPLGLLVTGLTAAAVAASGLSLTDLKSMWDRAKEGVAGFQAWVEGFMANFMENMKILGDWLKKTWDRIWTNLEGPMTKLWDSFKSQVASVLPYVKDFASKAAGFLLNLGDNIDRLHKWWKENWRVLLDDIGNAFKAVWDNSVYNASVAFERLVKLASLAVQQISIKFDGVGSSLLKSIALGLAKSAMKITEFLVTPWGAASMAKFGAKMAGYAASVGDSPEQSFLSQAKDIVTGKGERQFVSPLSGYSPNLTAPELNLNWKAPEGMGGWFDWLDLPEFKTGMEDSVKEAGKEANKAADGVGKAAGDKIAEGVKLSLAKKENKDKLKVKAEVSLNFDAALWGSMEAMDRIRDFVQRSVSPGKKSIKESDSTVYASRGLFTPRGTDVVPAMLTPGETVLTREQTRQYRPIIDAMRNSTIYAAQGGIIGRILAGKPAFWRTPEEIKTEYLIQYKVEQLQRIRKHREEQEAKEFSEYVKQAKAAPPKTPQVQAPPVLSGRAIPLDSPVLTGRATPLDSPVLTGRATPLDSPVLTGRATPIASGFQEIPKSHTFQEIPQVARTYRSGALYRQRLAARLARQAKEAPRVAWDDSSNSGKAMPTFDETFKVPERIARTYSGGSRYRQQVAARMANHSEVNPVAVHNRELAVERARAQAGLVNGEQPKKDSDNQDKTAKGIAELVKLGRKQASNKATPKTTVAGFRG